jgi:pyruvate formate lyase activating enzyme
MWWGEWVSTDEIYDRICRDAVFYKHTGGGVTLGGGDPLLQPGPAITLLRRCRENGINTAIETAGNYDFSVLREAASYCDTIHFDVKGWSEKTHILRTGVSNRRILDNLTALDKELGTLMRIPQLIVRIPLLPDYNFKLDEFSDLAEYLLALKHLTTVEILPFHNLGVYKYSYLGLNYPLSNLSNLKEDDVEEYRQALSDAGLPVIVSIL